MMRWAFYIAALVGTPVAAQDLTAKSGLTMTLYDV